MRKQTIILAALLIVPARVHASSRDSPRLSTSTIANRPAGAVIARRMVAALLREQRIQVRGRLAGPGKQSVQYLVRYQATAREYLRESGGAWNHIQIGKGQMSGLQAISIGKAVYTSTDGHHWMHGTRLVSPSALDVISINPANAPCCLAGPQSGVQVTNLGARTWHRISVYALGFITTSATGSASGTVLVDRRSSLPLDYTESTGHPVSRGSFTLTYGGTFTISSPASR